MLHVVGTNPLVNTFLICWVLVALQLIVYTSVSIWGIIIGSGNTKH